MNRENSARSIHYAGSHAVNVSGRMKQGGRLILSDNNDGGDDDVLWNHSGSTSQKVSWEIVSQIVGRQRSKRRHHAYKSRKNK